MLSDTHGFFIASGRQMEIRPMAQFMVSSPQAQTTQKQLSAQPPPCFPVTAQLLI